MRSKAANGKLLFATVGAFVALAFGMQGAGHLREGQESPPMARMTLEGALECLRVSPGYPPDEGCTLGLRADDGSRYAFDTMLMSMIPEPHGAGDRIIANGVFVPIERLSTDRWRRYDIKGIFSATDGLRVVD